MSNRAYLYSLSNRPQFYTDRPDTICGLSEWPYFIPFTFRVLMSGDPMLCASLLSDGFDDEPENSKTKLYAISSNFEKGFERLKKFIAILRPMIEPSYLSNSLDETLAFLEAHRNDYLLLETIELDTMEFGDEENLLACVKNEIAECIKVGEAIDALPADKVAAGAYLLQAASQLKNSAFYGIRLDDDFDNTRDSKTEYPLGLYWSDILYFDLFNRADFEAAFADND
jgi:hypothetical protein